MENSNAGRIKMNQTMHMIKNPICVKKNFNGNADQNRYPLGYFILKRDLLLNQLIQRRKKDCTEDSTENKINLNHTFKFDGAIKVYSAKSNLMDHQKKSLKVKLKFPLQRPKTRNMNDSKFLETNKNVGKYSLGDINDIFSTTHSQLNGRNRFISKKSQMSLTHIFHHSKKQHKKVMDDESHSNKIINSKTTTQGCQTQISMNPQNQRTCTVDLRILKSRMEQPNDNTHLEEHVKIPNKIVIIKSKMFRKYDQPCDD